MCKISVIIPTYNREKYIAQAVESVLSQDYPNIEIIVVDDGSVDGTREIAAHYGDKIRYLQQENSGIASARNAGVAAAQGDLIAWLDSDDYYESGKLTAQMKYLNEHPEAEIVFTKYENFTEDEITPAIQARLSSEVDNRYYLASSLAKRSLVDEVGMRDGKYKAAEDTDWVLRAKIVYNKNLDHYIDTTYYKRRFHTSNIVLSEASDRNFCSGILMENLKKKRAMEKTK